jgi:hypothetical protein
MSMCCCSLAGTAACARCANNGLNSGLTVGPRVYEIVYTNRIDARDFKKR